MLNFWTRREFINAAAKFTVSLIFMRSHKSNANPISNAAAVEEVLLGQREDANAAWWGYHKVSATAALQSAIRSGATKVIVPNMGTPWVVDPIYLESNQELLFEKGTVLVARKGAFQGKGDCLVNAINKENITLRGSQTVFRMHREDYSKGQYSKSEWRHCLSLHGCQNIHINGLQLNESGGDGLYIGRGIGEKSRPFCENLIINNVSCDRNYRQGISVISARNLRIEKCKLSNTLGTSPQAGIDYEPNRPDEFLQNCTLSDTIIEENKNYGILIVLKNLNKYSQPISLKVERCRIRLNGKSAIKLLYPETSNPPTGSIIFKENRIEGACALDHMSGVELIL